MITVAKLLRRCERNGWDPANTVLFLEGDDIPGVATVADESFATTEGGGQLFGFLLDVVDDDEVEL